MKIAKSFLFIIFLSVMFSFACIFSSCATQGVTAASRQDAPQLPDNKVSYKTIPITMEMEAGAALHKEWPGGDMTRHTGIGWIHPFGRSEYTAGTGYPEAKDYPMPSYFNEEWMDTYGTRLFCIYMLEDGNIYAYDGIVGNLDPYDEDVDDGKMDYLLNVIVGGTGAYEGATGMLLGRTPGRGTGTEVSEDYFLPVSILKLMEGYIKIPVKE